MLFFKVIWCGREVINTQTHSMVIHVTNLFIVIFRPHLVYPGAYLEARHVWRRAYFIIKGRDVIENSIGNITVLLRSTLFFFFMCKTWNCNYILIFYIWRRCTRNKVEIVYHKNWLWEWPWNFCEFMLTFVLSKSSFWWETTTKRNIMFLYLIKGTKEMLFFMH